MDRPPHFVIVDLLYSPVLVGLRGASDPKRRATETHKRAAVCTGALMAAYRLQAAFISVARHVAEVP
jgi:hypothetical protein